MRVDDVAGEKIIIVDVQGNLISPAQIIVSVFRDAECQTQLKCSLTSRFSKVGRNTDTKVKRLYP